MAVGVLESFRLQQMEKFLPEGKATFIPALFLCLFLNFSLVIYVAM